VNYRQIIHKVPCPTCGAGIGKACGTGAGRFRLEAHEERVAKAQGVMQNSKSAISKWLLKFAIKRS
jgi:hypothetical protein